MPTVTCARCDKTIPSESALYSGAGELICPACVAADKTEELDARGEASRRRGRIALGVAVAFVVLVPCAMFLAGLGKLMGEAILALGIAFVFAAAFVLRRRGVMRFVPARYAGYLLVLGAVTVPAGIGVSRLARVYQRNLESFRPRIAEDRRALGGAARINARARSSPAPSSPRSAPMRRRPSPASR